VRAPARLQYLSLPLCHSFPYLAVACTLGCIEGERLADLETYKSARKHLPFRIGKPRWRRSLEDLLVYLTRDAHTLDFIERKTLARVYTRKCRVVSETGE